MPFVEAEQEMCTKAQLFGTDSHVTGDKERRWTRLWAKSWGRWLAVSDLHLNTGRPFWKTLVYNFKNFILKIKAT